MYLLSLYIRLFEYVLYRAEPSIFFLLLLSSLPNFHKGQCGYKKKTLKYQIFEYAPAPHSVTPTFQDSIQ
jgi:hypothetical protein